jgi:hypothetical protein
VSDPHQAWLAVRGQPLEGWSPFDEDLLLRAVHVDLVRRSLGFLVTYDDYVYDDAPTGEWWVEIEDASPITLTRLADAQSIRGPGSIQMIHKGNPAGRGVLQFDGDEIIINTVGSELPAVRTGRPPEGAASPILASDFNTWTLQGWDDDSGQPWDLELRGLTFDVDSSALRFEVRDHSTNPDGSDGTDRLIVLEHVVSFSISVRHPEVSGGARRVEEAYVDGRTYYLHHPVVTLSASIDAT